MRWSKLKTMIEDRMAPSLAGRVQVHVTTYGRPDWMPYFTRGRGWITVDGREIANFSTDQYLVEHWRLKQETGMQQRVSDIPDPLRERDILPRWWFEDALWDYLSLSIDDAVSSENFLIRALAMTDRRLGKRRLRRLQIRADEHPLIHMFYTLRCVAEGVDRSSSPACG